MQQVFAISGLTNCIVSILIAIFVLWKGRNKVNVIFSLLAITTAIWSFGYWRWLSQYDSVDKAIFWLKLLTIASTWIPIFFLHWISLLLKNLISQRINRLILLLGYSFGIFFTLCGFAKLMIDGVSQKMFFLFWPNAGGMYIYYIFLVYIGLSFYTAIILIKSYGKSSGLFKNQIKYVALGTLIALIGGFFNFFLWYNIMILPYGNFIVPIYFILLTYAMVKYRLMDIRLFITRGILYFLLLLIVASSFTFITFSIGKFFEGGQNEIFLTLIASLVIVIGLDPLKKLLANLTDRFFYKGKVDYQEVLKDVSQEIAGELDMDDLLTNLGINLQKQLKLKNVRVFLQEAENAPYRYHQEGNFVDLDQNGPLIRYFQNNKDIVVAEELVRQKNDSKDQEEIQMLEVIEKRLEELKSALAVPVFSKDKLTSLLLVEDKLSGGTFSQADLDFFSVLAPQIAVALEKSKLFEEVQSAKVNLEHLVEQRTRDLKDRNRYLLALQRLINLTTRSLDFQKVMQTIADGISTELGFIGGMLNFIDFQRGYISVKAISNTPEIMEVQKLAARSPELYNISLREENNLAVKAILQKEIIKGERFADFLAPAIDKATADKMQMVLGIKTILAVPIYSEEKVIGVIDFVLAENIESIKDVEKEMMKSLADQVGIVYRNLSLYNQINLANQDLKQANVRLTQLDKSKSEFLSIASHQLRTPLTGIKGYLSMIIAGDFGAVPAKVLKVLNDVFMNTDRLTRLINIFLNVSRIESGRFEITKQDVDLTALVVEVIDAMKPSAEQKQVALTFHRPDQLLPNIPVDRDKVKDVLLNLVDNAIKYTPKGSIDVSAVSLGDALQVTIKDTGIGIAEGEDRELFKKFVRGDGVAQINTGGSGLGLFIAKKIVEAHGGKIWVESAGKNMGSSFIFTLPKK